MAIKRRGTEVLVWILREDHVRIEEQDVEACPDRTARIVVPLQPQPFDRRDVSATSRSMRIALLAAAAAAARFVALAAAAAALFVVDDDAARNVKEVARPHACDAAAVPQNQARVLVAAEQKVVVDAKHAQLLDEVERHRQVVAVRGQQHDFSLR